MRALVVFCHPKADSYSAAVLGTIVEKLGEAGTEYRVRDLYRENFSPVLTEDELDTYLDEAVNTQPVQIYVDDLLWADTLIFVYPTWWYGLPAMLKGWLDRVLLPGIAFKMPKAEGENISAGLGHIARCAVFTTCGASWWLTALIGSPGRKMLTRGLRSVCARNCKTYFTAHYLMDSSTPETRTRHLKRVARTMKRLTQ